MSRQHAHDLAQLFQGMRVKINLIDVNDASGRFRPPSEDEVKAFRDELFASSIPLSRRYAGGQDIGAACGTLAATQQGGDVIG
jgi:23S rRNA (adenine2503-C2)-methyltransferase